MSVDFFENLLFDKLFMISKTDLSGRIVYANEKFCNISQYSQQELIGSNHRMIKSNEHSDEFFNKLWKTIHSGKTWEGEIKNRAKDGSFYWTHTIITPNKTSNNDGYSSIRVDITKQKMYEEKLITAEKHKSEFLSVMAHEMKTPLSAIIINLEILNDLKLNEEQSEIYEEILNNVNILNHLMSETFEQEKLSLQKLKLIKTQINLKDFFDQLHLITNSLFEAKNISLSISSEIKLEECLMAVDTQKIFQIFTNLFTNAIDFSEDNASVKVTVVDKGDMYEFCVEDHGCGIKKESLSHIFDRYYQVDSSLRRTHGGTGVGLYLTKSIVELHGGKIWVESTVGIGTKIFFTLPKNLSK